MAEKENGKIVATSSMKTCACGAGCNCGCGYWTVGRIIWWVVGIIALIVVFCVGMKVGQFRDELRGMGMSGGYRGYPMMMRDGGYGGTGYSGGGSGYGGGIPPTTMPAPANGTATSSAPATTE